MSYSRHHNHESFHSPTIWRMEVRSNGECDSEDPAPRVRQHELSWTELGEQPGTVATAGAAYVDCREVPDRTRQMTFLTTLRIPCEGCWLVFLDGMRWYPKPYEQHVFVKFGSETGRAARFIDTDGTPSSLLVHDPSNSTRPVFMFMPRFRRPLDNAVTLTWLWEDLPVTAIHIQEDGGLFIVPNGRLIIWVRGSRDDVPLSYLNALRSCAGRINTVGPSKHHSNYRPASTTVVPTAIRRIVQDIMEMV